MFKKFFNHYFLVTIILVIITVLFTYPISFNMTTSFYGYPGDIFGTIWYLWWVKYSLFELKVSPLYSPIVGTPSGIYLPIITPVFPLLSLPSTLLFDEVFSFNFLILLSFVVSGIGMYALAYYLTKNKYASFVSSIIFAFSPYHIAHSMDHLGLSQIQWIPFCMLYMLKLDRERSYKSAAIFGIFLTLVIFTEVYYALFIVLVILTYILYRVYASELYILKNLAQCFTSKNLKITGIISMILMTASLAVYSLLIRPVLVPFKDMLPRRDMYELLIYSAKPWDFFLPPVYHPVFGQYVQEFVLSHLYGSNPTEQILYIGYVPLVLSIYAIFKFIKNKKMEEHNIVIIFLLFSVLALSFMLPAYLHIYDLKIPFSFSYLLYQVTQSFRVMSRFDVILMMSVSVLSGIGIKYILKEKIKKRSLIFVIVVILVILFEFAPIPSNISQIKRPEQNFPFSRYEYEYHTTKIEIPEEYNWLANQKGDFTIIEYPLAIAPGKDEIIHYRYLFFQRVHKKKLINGGQEALLRDIAKINETSPADKLKMMGVRYAIVHTDIMEADVNTSGFDLVRKFNNTLILETRG